MKERQTGLDFGTTTSVVCYKNSDEKGIKEITFNGCNWVPTLVLEPGKIKNKKGIEKSCDEAFGWDAEYNYPFYAYLNRNFKIDLLSQDNETREKAKKLTGKFFKYLYVNYKKQQEFSKGESDWKEVTYVTYPTKFPAELQQFLKKQAEAAGFPNVRMLSEAEAAMSYLKSYDNEETRRFFETHAGQKCNVMMIDMGAGTTDIIIFEYDVSNAENSGKFVSYPDEKDAFGFGGSEIDRLLLEFYENIYGQQFIINLGQNDERLGQAKALSDIKVFKEKTLSQRLNKNESVEELPGCLLGSLQALNDLDAAEIDRRKFEEFSGDYLTQFPRLITGALQKANMTGADIDLVLLAGGHSQWYFVREMLEKQSISADRIIDFANPHMIVARGAAIYKPYKPAYVSPVVKDSSSAEKSGNQYEKRYSSFRSCSSDCLINWGGCDTKGYSCSEYCTCDSVCTRYTCACDSNCFDCSCHHADTDHCNNDGLWCARD